MSLVSYINKQLDEAQKLTSEGFEDMMARHQANFADAMNMMIEGGNSYGAYQVVA